MTALMKRPERVADRPGNRGAATNLARPASPAFPARQTWLAVAVLATALAAFYGHTRFYPFVFDDKAYIITKPMIQHIGTSMFSSHRPVVDFTFAVNIALAHYFYQPNQPQRVPPEFGFHVVNLLIHLGAALALFGVVRRTLSRGALAARYGGMAWGLALAVALLWMVHPLQTQSVTYVYQRFESMMGLWFLLTFYCFLRAQDSPRAVWWYGGSVAACLLAIGSKEVAAVAPLLLIWYDRAFVSSSWRELYRRHWPFYAALGGVLGVLALLVILALPVYEAGGMLVGKELSSLAYARTQPGVILHYLRLALWPQGLCLDYNWPLANTVGQIVPPLLGILALLGLTVWCIWRHPAWGFVGGWFFLILAPSSSFIPIRDRAFEHRMYLSLAAVVVLVVLGGYELLRRLPAFRRSSVFEQRLFLIGPLLLLAIVLGTATFYRNQTYQSEIALWEDIVQKVPNNPRGYSNLGIWYQNKQPPDYARAEAMYREALKKDPNYYDAHYNLALRLAQSPRQEDREEAMRHYEACLASSSWFVPDAYNNLALLQKAQGDLAGARRNLETAVQGNPTEKAFRINLIHLLIQTNPEAARAECRRWVEQQPDRADVLGSTAALLARMGHRSEALENCRQALELQPKGADLHLLFSELIAPDDPQLAISHLETAIALQPRFVQAYLELGDLCARRQQVPKAIACFQTVLQLDPRNERARRRLRELTHGTAPPASRP